LTGPAPLTVNFDGTGSTDPENGALAYAWDLDGDGAYDDSTAAQPSFTYQTPTDFTVRLRVTDPQGGQDTDSILISVGNSPPTAVIDQPAANFTWHVGEAVSFAGHGTDPDEGNLPGAALSWEVTLHHCPSDCHVHPYQSFAGVASGSFPAPDHEATSFLEVRLTVTDTRGLSNSTSVFIYPEITTVTLATSPTGLSLDLNGETAATQFTRTVIVGSANALTAPSPQSQAGTSYQFASWSDGGAQTHVITAGSAPTTYTATFQEATTIDAGIQDFKFVPKDMSIALGQEVRWTNNGPSAHTVTDNTGMGMFDSGTLATGSVFRFTYTAAGRFNYRCMFHNRSDERGRVSVPMMITPGSGATTTPFQLTWATVAPPAGYVFDVQIRRPGATSFSNWRLNQTVTGATFVPDAGTGTYEFQARLRNPGFGSAAYSAPFAITVS
jgi:plastocyanin